MSETAIIREIGERTFELVPTSRAYFHRYGSGREFDVYETTGGRRKRLNEGIDPLDEDLATDEVLLALAEPRRQELVAVMRYYKIEAGPDYQHEEAYELVYSTEPVGAYVVISGDETYHWIDVVETREDAAKSVAGDIEDQMGNEYPHHPEEIRELDTGRSIPFSYEVVVTLTD